ncbi:UDP-N-acetylenolpyruvoylglucosamine reductase [Klebsiella pneumoniae IS39]|nr:UDP-N-acetylenolpyruvoylglucosamine reductase [Klebsiella pneumoniae IS39]
MNHSLKPWNTFGIERFAKTIVRAETEQQLLSAWQTAAAAGEPTLILGEGSNVLFLNDYAGTVILNRIMGIEVSETPEAWRLHVAPAKTGISWCSSRYSMRCQVWKIWR